ncbi:hypothetical protein Q6A90_06265 [Aliarcobacter skirrowii]|uniref:hypothetical protein n=1 Tax=Aliarcobacter skirrowii TaxID=28200 RepID=UPI0029BA2559|nr:hypothetical protein [Aliarcobacter skirrowii]MDX4061971.1 hypothetical protein [Aliarcobacter skirrowii]
MKSNLKNSFSNKDSDKILVDVLKSFETEEKQQNEKLLISYYIYENDKKDEGKKNIDTSDIKSRMSCVIESFLTI